ncbi:glycosyltransferase [Plectonema cf. radiosum LEGE 06105]|uniref:Glycosyltransferase n=1 Tax=Plectonema cf. radiosum LEGE 06105 TaxID=945769 RepID=A0A8J7K1U0_9CYAN|nr:glycosyltransferase [Plectonema radiosum]MBE9213412.1 glycosyltransferase [Plectonema cf. radiosum LEGE 06105]
MNILIVTPYLGSNYGGPAKSVIELVRETGNQGVFVDVVTTNANTYENLSVPLNEWIYEKNYRIRYFACWNKNDLIISQSLNIWLFNHVIQYDLVHTNTIFAPLISFTHWSCQFHQIPYIITPRGMLEPWALSYKAHKKYLYYNLFEKLALQQASAIQVLASSEAEQVKSLGFQHSIVVPNGIHRHEFEVLTNPEMFYQKFPTTRNKNLILFLGRIDPKKGLDLLATAFAKVHNQFPQTHLIVAGPDSIDFLPTVQNYFKQAGCLNAVTFTGMLTGSIKQAALAAASLYVAPSYSEGFSMSVLEGMASGLPCVITTGCNFPEASTASSAHVVDINADAIANALINCLKNPQEAQIMGMKARQFIFQNYTWEQAAKKLLKTYTELTHKKSIQNNVSRGMT